jgi:hypothetical protein
MLSAAASAAGGKLADGLAAAGAALPAPGWPAESVALQGVSQLAAAPGADAAAQEALLMHMRRYSYFVLCAVFAVVMWQLAASIPGALRTRAACAWVVSAEV